jgi:hypothetical protein
MSKRKAGIPIYYDISLCPQTCRIHHSMIIISSSKKHAHVPEKREFSACEAKTHQDTEEGPQGRLKRNVPAAAVGALSFFVRMMTSSRCPKRTPKKMFTNLANPAHFFHFP